MKVVGIGQCSLDSLFIVDSFPAPDTKKEVLEWTKAGGGPVATALVSLARLGADCSFYGIIGDDEAGGIITDSLLSEKIDVKGLLSRPRSESQIAFICVDQSSGQRTIFWKRPSSDPLQPDEIPDDFLVNADFLIVDGLMADASLYAVKKAREMHVPAMLDAGRLRKGMRELAALCDYVVGSEEFARELAHNGKEHASGEQSFCPEKAVRSMTSSGVKAVTITLGKEGSITFSGDEIFRTQAFPVDVVDTTGAGDVFHGGYIYGLLQGWHIKDVVRFASAFAALKCRKLGGRAGIPSLQEVEGLLDSSSAGSTGR